MTLVELLEKDKTNYNRFVAAQKGGSFLQSWEWGEWQKNLGRQVHRFFLTDDKELIVNNRNQESITGAIQLIKMPLPFGRYYLYAPYGPVIGGEKLEVGDWNELAEQLKDKFLKAVFIRLEPKFQPPIFSLQISTSNIQPGKTLVLNLSKSEEQLLSEMHHKTRYNIKLAQKHGVEILEEFDISIGHGLYFEEAIELILETSKRQKFRTFHISYYKNLVNFFSLNKTSEIGLHIYKGIFQNQLLACAVMIDFANTRTFLFGGSGMFHKNIMVPYLLHWQAIKDAKLKGLDYYDFWGIETAKGETPGFVRFKLGFGGQQKNYSGAFDFVISRVQYVVYRIARFANLVLLKFKRHSG